MYSTRHLETLLNVSHQTVKNWCKEFARYLSPTATPPANHQRSFTDDDLTVLILVGEMKTAGATYETIHAALQAGQRGSLPETSLAITETPALMLVLRQRVTDLEAQLIQANEIIAERGGQIKLLKEQLAEALSEIRQLERKDAQRGD